MPQILDRCVNDVQAKGHTESSAYAICTKSLGLGKMNRKIKSQSAAKKATSMFSRKYK